MWGYIVKILVQQLTKNKKNTTYKNRILTYEQTKESQKSYKVTEDYGNKATVLKQKGTQIFTKIYKDYELK